MNANEPLAERFVMRPGQLSCACPTDCGAHDDNRAVLAIGFGLAVLAQTLVLTVLPEQSRLMAPTVDRIGWPFALLLTGAAAASFPAALLLDSFGRRAAFGLGASLGAGGGALCVFAIMRSNFLLLCLGAFWLGIAQGFALFYRHVAAQGARGPITVLAGGAGAALATPLVVALADSVTMTLAMAAMLYIAALALAVRQPHLRARHVAHSVTKAPDRSFFIATAAGAFAWCIMAAGMLHGPLTLAVCSAAPAFIGGAMGSHLLAMYGPAVLAARWPRLFVPAPTLIGGLALLLAGGGVVFSGLSVASVTLGLVAIGVGWSIVNIATLGFLHDGASPSRTLLALHDLCLWAAAASGTLAL